MRRKVGAAILLLGFLLVGCNNLTVNETREIPEGPTLVDKKNDFWNGDYAYEIVEENEVWLTNVESEDEEDGQIKKIEMAEIPQKVAYQEKEYTVVGIGEGAFDFCENLVEVKMPDSIQEIGKGAFSGCINLKTCNFPSDLTKIGEAAFSITSLNEIVLGDQVTDIGVSAFAGIKELKRIILPDSLKVIETCAFYNCEGLEEVTILSPIAKIDTLAFENCDSLKIFYVPEESIEYYRGQLEELSNEESDKNKIEIKSLEL